MQIFCPICDLELEPSDPSNTGEIYYRHEPMAIDHYIDCSFDDKQNVIDLDLDFDFEIGRFIACYNLDDDAHGERLKIYFFRYKSYKQTIYVDRIVKELIDYKSLFDEIKHCFKKNKSIINFI